MRGNGGYHAWWVSTFLMTIGIIAAVLSIVFALLGGMVNPDEPESSAKVSAALPLAFAAIALIGGGAALRCYGCCDDECCGWDEKPNATLERSAGNA